MKESLSSFIVPRININSRESINEAIYMTKEIGFDTFILFASDKVVFGENNKFSLKTFQETKGMLQDFSSKEILFFIDAESGFGHRCIEGLDINLETLDLSEEEKIYKNFKLINDELFENQISFNLAPVVDLNNLNEEILIGRSYSNDPKIVSKIASIFLSSCKASNIIPCLKHFPGHGAAKGDTHSDLIISPLSLEELKSSHLIPFIELINDTDFIMINHLSYESLDKSLCPATMSKTIMENLLRKDLGYKGLIISDSIRMGALSRNFTEEEVIWKFILNGGDLVLDPINPIESLSIMKKIVKSSSNLMEEKLAKINSIKNKARNLMKK